MTSSNLLELARMLYDLGLVPRDDLNRFYGSLLHEFLEMEDLNRWREMIADLASDEIPPTHPPLRFKL